MHNIDIIKYAEFQSNEILIQIKTNYYGPKSSGFALVRNYHI